MTDSHTFNSYSFHRRQLVQVINDMQKSLERYAERDNASDTYLDINNQRIDTIADFVNVSDTLIDELTRETIPVAEHQDIVKSIHQKYMPVIDGSFWLRFTPDRLQKTIDKLPKWLKTINL